MNRGSLRNPILAAIVEQAGGMIVVPMNQAARVSPLVHVEYDQVNQSVVIYGAAAPRPQTAAQHRRQDP